MKYSEIFYSIQGEGQYTGNLTSWVRLFSCNLQCNGFGQPDPTDQSTYRLPYLDINPYKYKQLEDLPVFDRGCDSSYSWSAKFKHLQREGTPKQVAQRLINIIPQKTFHPANGNKIHLCFTGGEPLLPIHQTNIQMIVEHYIENSIQLPQVITFETNGTQKLGTKFIEFLKTTVDQNIDTCVFFSVSPKLYYVTGETDDRSFNIDSLNSLNIPGYTNGQLKFVVNQDSRCWEELDRKVDIIRKNKIDFPIWVMPVGALDNQQYEIGGTIAEQAMRRGFHVAARVHTYLFGNRIGT